MHANFDAMVPDIQLCMCCVSFPTLNCALSILQVALHRRILGWPHFLLGMSELLLRIVLTHVCILGGQICSCTLAFLSMLQIGGAVTKRFKKLHHSKKLINWDSMMHWIRVVEHLQK